MSAIRILVVEDEAITAMNLQTRLVQLGYEVPLIAASGAEAIACAAQLHPDLILMDITLDGPMTGIEAAAAIWKSERIPVIFVTAHNDLRTIDTAKVAEPYGYITKPYTISTLQSAIEIALFKGATDARLRESEERLRFHYDNSPLAIVEWDADFIVTRWSGAAPELFGWSAEETIGRPITDLRLIGAADLPVVRDAVQRLAAGASKHTVFFLRAATKEGKDVHGEWYSSVMRDARGRLTSVLSQVLDVSARRLAQDARARENNLAALGVLAGGIAHDFNNVLQTLLGCIAMAKTLLPPTSQAYQFLDLSRQAGAEATALAEKFVAFAPGGIATLTTIEPAGLVREAVAAALKGSAVQASFELPPGLPKIHVDVEQVRRAVENIAINAREAAPAAEVLLVGAAPETLRENEIAGLAPGNYLRITIRDQGPGIDPAILPKIFDPYFSTKAMGQVKGMGLGLTISDAIVRKHHGAITVDAVPGAGAAFHLHLPAAGPEGGQGARR